MSLEHIKDEALINMRVMFKVRLLGGAKSVASATVSIGGGTDSNFAA